jgi:uncharacterized protein
MNAMKVTIVRVYIKESDHLLQSICDYLKNDAKIRGFSVFRAISGFGDSRVLHTSSLVDLSLDLPLAVEFFDEPKKIKEVISHLNKTIKHEHIVFWDAETND